MHVTEARIDGPQKSQLRDLRLHFIPTEDRNATRRLFRATIMPAFFILLFRLFLTRQKRHLNFLRTVVVVAGSRNKRLHFSRL